jgi:type III secretion protein C
MTHPFSLRKHAVSLCLCAALAFGSGTAALAADPPFPNNRISLTPNQQPVGETVQDLFTQAGMSVKISSRVKGRAAGRWIGSPAEIWRQLSRAYNLVAYYDGSVVRVYDATEISSRTFNTADPKAVEQQARQMGLTGSGNSVKAGNGSIIVSGVPQFLETIAGLASKMTAPATASGPAMIPTTATTPVAGAAASGIVSPLAGRPSARLPAPYALDYVTTQRATARNPLEIRIYNLKYADAGDRVINLGDRDQIIPGVATLLRQTLGDGIASGAQVIERGNPGVRRVIDQPLPGGGAYGPYSPYYGPMVLPIPYGGPQEQQPAPAPDPLAPRITFSQSTNSVIVADRPTMMATYDALITSFDRPRAQIEIEATIIDIDVNRLKQLGVDWSFGFRALGGLFGGQVLTPNGSASTPNVQGSFFRSESQFVNAQISALSQNGTLSVISNVRLMSKENEPAVTDNRQIIPVRFSGQFQGGLQEYRVGILMAITPKIAKEVDGLATSLQIDLRDGQIRAFQADGIPLIDNAQLTTNATIRQGESLIIGGITIDRQFENKSKVPGVGDIPIVGEAFKRRTKGSSRRERVVIITPRVISDSSGELVEVSAAQEPEVEMEEEEEEAAELSTRKAKRSKRRPSSAS